SRTDRTHVRYRSRLPWTGRPGRGHPQSSRRRLRRWRNFRLQGQLARRHTELSVCSSLWSSDPRNVTRTYNGHGCEDIARKWLTTVGAVYDRPRSRTSTSRAVIGRPYSYL